MDNTTIRNIIDFLEKKDNKKHKDRDTFIWKVKLGYPLTKEDLIVKGDLNLYKSDISSLPKNLKVEGNLNLSYAKIMHLPKGLKVGENLLIMNTNLKKYTDEELIEMVKPGFIKGEIFRG